MCASSVGPAEIQALPNEKAKMLPASDDSEYPLFFGAWLRCDRDAVLDRGRSEEHHRDDARGDEEDLSHGGGVGAAPVQAGDQVGHGDIEETGGRQRQKVGQERGQAVERDKRRNGARGAGASDESTLSSSARLRE